MEEELNPGTKALELAMAHINKQYGKGSIMRLGEGNDNPWESISTGALGLDLALGIGGLPKGRVVEIYGPESSGKSTLTLTLIAEAQRLGGVCAYVDAEHAMDPIYARSLKVDTESLLISQPSTAEEALEIVDVLTGTGAVSVIVVDSVAALTPKAELEGTMFDQQMGLLPRLMSKSMRKIVGKISDTGTIVVFVNQIREKVGLVFGNPETTPGGRALRFASSVRIDLRKKEDIKDKSTGEVVGVRVKAKVVKNKMAPPLRMTEFDIRYGLGVDRYAAVLDCAMEAGFIKAAGAWLKWSEDDPDPARAGVTFAQGRERAIEALASDIELTNELRTRVLDAVH